MSGVLDVVLHVVSRVLDCVLHVVRGVLDVVLHVVSGILDVVLHVVSGILEPSVCSLDIYPSILVKWRTAERRFSTVHAYESSAAGYHPQDGDQDHRADEGHEDAGDVDAVHGIRHVQQRCGEEAADQGAHDAHDDVADEAVAATAHHLAGQPTSDQPNDDPCKNTHCSPFLSLRDGYFRRQPGRSLFLPFIA